MQEDEKASAAKAGKEAQQRTPAQKKRDKVLLVVFIAFAVTALAASVALFLFFAAASKQRLSNMDESERHEATPTISQTESVGQDGLTSAQRMTLEEIKLIEPIEIHDESNGSYNVFVGTLKNRSDNTHYFIKVKGEFKDANDNTIDTAWTYAVGDEGLAPGESTKFTLSVRRDDRIAGISCYTYDFT